MRTCMPPYMLHAGLLTPRQHQHASCTPLHSTTLYTEPRSARHHTTSNNMAWQHITYHITLYAAMAALLHICTHSWEQAWQILRAAAGGAPVSIEDEREVRLVLYVDEHRLGCGQMGSTQMGPLQK